MRKAIMTIALSLVGIIALLAGVWLTNLFGLKEGVYVSQIVKMRVAPERLTNPKTPLDYGMAYTDVDIMTADNVRLSAWEIMAATPSDQTLIVNHPLTTTRYGSLEGLDGVAVEFLPMIKHLHNAGYNIVMYDHRGQGDSDGGVGKTLIGSEAPVGAGETEWQDVAASLRYVKAHPTFGDDQIGFLSQCMGANATFLAWQNEPELFNDPMITSLVAIQPPVSYAMIDRFIKAKTGMDLVDKVLDAQVRKDEYTFDPISGRNDIQDVVDITPTENQLIWIGPEEAKPFGTGKRFDGYGYFNAHPDELILFLKSNFS